MEDTPSSSNRCPSCGQYVGPYDRCPYCGAATGRRLAVRILKYGSLLLALLGVAVLLLVARHSQVPVAGIGNLAGTMNWAYVRVEGQVSRQPSYDPQAHSLQFWVEDGTGEMMVAAYRADAEALLAANRVPALGDGVAVEGTLRIREDFQYLVVAAPDRLEIRPAGPVEMDVASIAAAPRYQKVTATGVVRAVRTPYDGLRILALRDASGQIDVALFSDAALADGPFPDLPVGQVVRVTGVVDFYENRPQIAVGRAGDLFALDGTMDIAPRLPIGELETGEVGRLYALRGLVSRLDTFSAGVKGQLDDGSGTVTLLLWQDLYDRLPEREGLAPGAEVQVVGEVAEYRGELEIVPELPSDVVLLATAGPIAAPTAAPTAVIPATPAPLPDPTRASASPSPTAPAATASPQATERPTDLPTPVPSPTLAAETRPIGAITAGDVGQTLTLDLAGIAGVSYLSRGVRFTLTDPSGSIVLLLWQDVLEEVPGRFDLFPGSQVRIRGTIDEYEGQLEIVPRQGPDVTVVSRGQRPPVEERTANDVTPSDEGRFLVVEGTVARIDSRRWINLWLDDGTGQIQIYVPERAVAYLPPGIGPGTRLRVTGEVDVYQGEVEIVPLAAVDVEVR